MAFFLPFITFVYCGVSAIEQRFRRQSNARGAVLVSCQIPHQKELTSSQIPVGTPDRGWALFDKRDLPSTKQAWLKFCHAIARSPAGKPSQTRQRGQKKRTNQIHITDAWWRHIICAQGTASTAVKHSLDHPTSGLH